MKYSISEIVKRAVVFVLFVNVFAGGLFASETENHKTRIIPAPGKVEVDGKADDWDFSGGTFACGDVENYRDDYSIWLYLMYDADNLYILSQWNDPTPLNNPQSSRGGHGFKGDCLQVRLGVNYDKAGERVTHMTAWQDKDGVLKADLAYGRDFKGGSVDNITDAGGQHAMGLVEDNPNAYYQELAIPWKLIASDGYKPNVGDTIKVTVEPNFTAGKMGRITIKDLLYNPSGKPDRIFTFTSHKDWGSATFVGEGNVEPQNLAMAGGDEFQVSLKDGKPEVDWSPLMVEKELPGHKKIDFDMPFDGRVSMIIKDKSGEVVRHLLNDVPYSKGKHSVNWDGLATPMWRTPTDILPAGEYTWEAIAHEDYSLKLLGWVDSHGIPWNGTDESGWGGDHGRPRAVAAYKDTMLLGWSGSEAGYGLIAVDKDGNKLWNLAAGPTGGYNYRIAVDGDEAFGFAKNIFKFSAKDGEFGEFTRNGKAFFYTRELWEDEKAPKGKNFPARNDSMDVKDGVIYLGFMEPAFTVEQVNDWKKVAEFLLGDSKFQQEMFYAVSKSSTDHSAAKYKVKLRDFLEGKSTLADTGESWAPLSGMPQVLNAEYLDRTDLVLGAEKLSPIARRKANREWLNKKMGGVFDPLRTGFVVKVDKNTGKTLGYFNAPSPTFIDAVNDSLLYIISDYSQIWQVNPKTGKAKSIVKGKDFEAMTLDQDGNLVVVQSGDINQVVVYNPNGKELRRIGMKGGRPATGKWQKDAMKNPVDVAFDSSGRLWVTEYDSFPKRISVWDYASGKNVDEFFGPTSYGASGACVNPFDPDIMISSGVEFKLDENGRGHAQQVIKEQGAIYSTYATPANGRLYLVRARQWSPGVAQTIEVFEKLKDGTYILRSSIVWNNGDYYSQERFTSFWSDKNGNAKADPGETVVIPERVSLAGLFRLNMDAHNLTLVGPTVPWHESKEKAKVFEYKVGSYTKCGAPVWDVKNRIELPFTYLDGKDGEKIAPAQYIPMQPSLDNKSLLSAHKGSPFGSRSMVECFDLSSGSRKWWYPNQWVGVHGGHKAPPGEPGLLRAVYGMIGQFEHPVVGNVWVLNTDKGEWHMLSDSGFYVGTLFNGDVMSRRFPEEAVMGADISDAPPGSGSEDFGGSVIQTKDGDVYLQSGKTGAWRILLEGLESIQEIGSGNIVIKPEEIKLAEKEYENQKQGSAGNKMMDIEKKTVKFSGLLHKDFGNEPISYQKTYDTRVKTYAAYDDKNLYLGYEVSDPTPWVNGAAEVVAMYQGGDTVDLQIGTNPVADGNRAKASKGDLRLSIGNFKGKPTAVLYRKVWDQKKPREFTSGLIKSYVLDYVDVLDSADINVKVDKDKYIVEAAIPLKELGLSPDKTASYKADFGVTHGNLAGKRTQLRTYWSNQETGLVADAVYELMLTPKNWGEIKFK